MGTSGRSNYIARRERVKVHWFYVRLETHEEFFATYGVGIVGEETGREVSERDVRKRRYGIGDDVSANQIGDLVEHSATSSAGVFVRVAFEPTGEPEASKDDVLEDEGAGGYDERLLAHASVSHHDG